MSDRPAPGQAGHRSLVRDQQAGPGAKSSSRSSRLAMGADDRSGPMKTHHAEPAVAAVSRSASSCSPWSGSSRSAQSIRGPTDATGNPPARAARPIETGLSCAPRSRSSTASAPESRATATKSEVDSPGRHDWFRATRTRPAALRSVWKVETGPSESSFWLSHA